MIFTSGSTGPYCEQVVVQVEALFDLAFIEEHENVVIVGPNGVGKTMLAPRTSPTRPSPAAIRLASSRPRRCSTTSVDGSARQHRFKRYTSPQLLTIDELGYLRYYTRHADLLYEVVRQRYKAERSIIITTNKAFAEWNQVFDSAACVVTLIDRLCHRAELVKIDGSSFRAKEAEDRTKRRRATDRTETTK